eukprot:794083-Amphidinium_carterae.1
MGCLCCCAAMQKSAWEHIFCIHHRTRLIEKLRQPFVADSRVGYEQLAELGSIADAIRHGQPPGGL